MALNLFQPDQSRTLTYYDRCAIALNGFEMVAVRLQVRIVILATPLSRSLNLRYPYYKEFYGYGQSFFQNVLYEDFPVEYTEQFVFDYWNQHSTLAHQITDVLQRLKVVLTAYSNALANLSAAEFPAIAQILLDTLEILLELASCFVVDIDGEPNDGNDADDYLATFQMPVNLFRFKFAPGTVFAVTLDSWTLGLSAGGSFPGNPEVEAPYDTDNPNGNTPTPSGARDPEGRAYGNEPPDSSPLDPNLDPDDFSNAPLPEPEPDTINLQGWQFPGRAGSYSPGVAVGCPGGTIAVSVPSLSGIDPAFSLGVFPIRIRGAGEVSREDLESSFPGFDANNNVLDAGACGVVQAVPFD